MRIELRILSGARAGQSQAFDQPTILVGRKLTSDLRFDAHGDIDVSAQHAEIRDRDGTWYVIDNGSTNGTLVNGKTIRGESRLSDGDVIAFGKNGPTVEVRAKGEPTGKTPAVPRTGSSKAAKVAANPGKPSTEERVAVAVRHQTRGLKQMLIGTVIGLSAIAIAAYWIGLRKSSAQLEELNKSIARAESLNAVLRTSMHVGDTSFVSAVKRENDSLRAKIKALPRGNEAKIAELKQELEQAELRQKGLTAVDYTAIRSKNDAAIAMLISEYDGKTFGGTAFCITRGGLMVTNRHNVRSTSTGAMTSRLDVVFSNTSTRHPAHVIRVNDGDDLALIQLDEKADYPTVEAISGTGEVAVGSMLVAIGFPLSLELPMEGNRVNTTLSAGPASKRISDMLQISIYGSHGMSGMPVFDTKGLVVGVVYGGPPENPQIIYSVPSDRLAQFLGDLGRTIVR